MKIETIDWEKTGGLLPVVVQSHQDGSVLMLGYMNEEALAKTLQEGIVTFYSRTKQRLWTKGETSKNILRVREISLDCDGDTLLILVDTVGPVCHKGTPSCFNVKRTYSDFLLHLESVIDDRLSNASANSYVQKITERGTSFVAQKVGEEAVEVSLASVQGDKHGIVQESADLLFHLLVNLRYHKISLHDVVQTLQQRHQDRKAVSKGEQG